MPKAIFFLFMGIGLILTWVSFGLSKDVVRADHECATNHVNIIYPSSGAVLSGSTAVTIRTDDPSNLNGVELLVRLATSTETTSIGVPPSWFMSDWTVQWDTTQHSDGQYVLMARSYIGFENVCSSPELAVSILNSPPPPPVLNVVLQPSRWEGHKGASVSVRARVSLVGSDGSSSDVTTGATYTWSSTIGTFRGTGPSITFYTGERSGQGSLKVVVSHDGRTAEASIPIKILEPEIADPTIVSEQLIFNQDPLIKELDRCIRSAIGDDGFIAIYEGRRRISLEILGSNWDCFGRDQLILGPKFAPLSPGDVKNLPLAPRGTIQIRRPLNKTIDANGTSQLIIEISGTANPNNLILLYVFSDPLVLVTKTDSRGNWVYHLTEPLQPGQHEVYVVMKSDSDEFTRSNPVNFSIAQAATTADNPLGASLILDDLSSRERLVFIIISTILILLASFTFYIFRKRVANMIKLRRAGA